LLRYSLSCSLAPKRQDARNEGNTTEVKLFTIEFEKNGTKGYAISSGDERITNVYAYVENGSLSDTLFIIPLKAALMDIEGACKADLICYYEEGKNIRLENDVHMFSRNDKINNQGESNVNTRSFLIVNGYLNTGRIVNLNWDQTSPFNQFVPYACSGNHPAYLYKAPAGCVPVACSQVIAYLRPPAISNFYNLSALRNQASFPYGNTNSHPLAYDVAVFVRYVGGMTNVSYGCDGSVTQIKEIRDGILILGN